MESDQYVDQVKKVEGGTEVGKEHTMSGRSSAGLERAARQIWAKCCLSDKNEKYGKAVKEINCIWQTVCQTRIDTKVVGHSIEYV